MAASIYIIEDQRIMLQTLETILATQDGLSVAGTAQDAETAMDAIPTLPVDIALVDVTLPKLNGIDLVRRLREQLPDLECLMLSGRTESEYVQRAQQVGAAGFVLKGDPAEVIEAIRSVLDGKTYVTARLKSAWETSPSGTSPNGAES